MIRDKVLRRGFATLIFAAALAGCGSSTPHSAYFMVTFQPGTPTPSDEGAEALDNAVEEASHSHPRQITIEAAAPAQGEDALAAARAKAIEDEFTDAGFDEAIIHVELRPASNYAASKDDFIIDLAYGVFVKP